MGSLKPPNDIRRSDIIFSRILKISGWLLPLLILSIGLFLFENAQPTIKKFGFVFILGTVWDPIHDIFGAGPVIYGTLASSLIAIIIGTPISVAVALLLSEIIPGRLSRSLSFLVEMLAAIPSVVYGLWGIFVLAPWMRSTIEPFLAERFGAIPIFSGPFYGVGLLSAGVILAIMIVPTISSICREIFRNIPNQQREAALALGATKWEAIRLAVLKNSKAGIFGSVTLGLGRALGETLAVTMVIGNRAEISKSIFAPSQTMASLIANEYAEATSQLHLSALIQVGLTLFLVTFVVNGLARVMVWQTTLRKDAQC